MMGTRYSEIKNYCHHHHVTLVAVSKTRTPDQILKLYEQGQKIFGENKVQELIVKHETVNKSIEWHLVGHLQTNKVKFVVPFVSLIQSVDSWKLLLEINKQAQENNRVVDVLLQIHIARELTKFGLSFQEAHEILNHPELTILTHIHIKGLMGMASLTDNEPQIRSEFRSLKLFFEEMRSGISGLQMTGSDPDTLSMGMSNDFRIAIEEGSTMVRIGSAIFGE